MLGILATKSCINASKCSAVGVQIIAASKDEPAKASCKKRRNGKEENFRGRLPPQLTTDTWQHQKVKRFCTYLKPMEPSPMRTIFKEGYEGTN